MTQRYWDRLINRAVKTGRRRARRRGPRFTADDVRHMRIQTIHPGLRGLAAAVGVACLIAAALLAVAFGAYLVAVAFGVLGVVLLLFAALGVRKTVESAFEGVAFFDAQDVVSGIVEGIFDGL